MALRSADKHCTMMATQPNAYLRTKVMTAGPAELKLMLFDGAIKFAQQGKAGIEAKDYSAAFEGISRCQSIIMELINALNHDADPKLCARLAGLYTFMYNRLTDTSTNRDPVILQEVIGLLEYERETWSQLLKQLAEENAQASKMQATPNATPADPKATTLPPNGSLIGGTVSFQG